MYANVCVCVIRIEMNVWIELWYKCICIHNNIMCAHVIRIQAYMGIYVYAWVCVTRLEMCVHVIMA